VALAKRALEKGLSVREVEAAGRGRQKRRRATRKSRTTEPILREWEERLQRVLGTQVRIDRIGKEGTIRIEYYSQEDLERVLELIAGAGEGRPMG
jgi:ParB family chromosome partitioning protein